MKEAPLRRDVRSLGMLLGEVLREQAGEALFAEVEELRQIAIRRREEAQADEGERFRNRAELGSTRSTWCRPIGWRARSPFTSN